MRPCNTRWPLPRDLRAGRSALGLALGLALGSGLLGSGCVSSGTYELVLEERDGLLTERTQLRDRVRQLETERKRLLSSNESLTNERRELLDDLEGLHGERERLTGEVAGLARTKRELGAELARREGQLAEREALLAARAEELAVLNRQLDQRNAELTARISELEERDAEIERLKLSYEGFVADLESEIADGQIVIEQLREGIRVNLPDATFFAPESVELTLHGKVTLAKVAAQLRPMSHDVEVQGHTDDMPPSPSLAEKYPSNWEVAAARAAAVVRQLVAHGISPERIRAVSYGSSRPVGPNDTPAERARNRRIEVRLIPHTEGPARPLAAALSGSGDLSQPSGPASVPQGAWRPAGDE